MCKTLRHAMLAYALMGVSSAPSARDIPVVAGTLLQCTLNEPELSSRTAVAGDPLVCYAKPLQELGCDAFPRGTLLAGHFAEYKNPGRLAGKGWIKLEFDRLILPNGEAPITARVVAVHGFKVDTQARIRGRGHARRDALGWAIPVLWPIKAATLLERGPFPALKGPERLVTLRLLDDVRIPCQRLSTSWLESSWHPFDQLESDLIPFFSSTLNHSSAGDASTGSVSSGDGQTAGKDLVVNLGTHKLHLSSWPPKPGPRTLSSIWSLH